MRAFFHRLADFTEGRHPSRDLANALTLGILVGSITGANISWLVVLLVVVVLNVRLRPFAAAWAGTVLLAGCARTPIEHLGRLLLDSTPLGAAIGRLGDGVLTALLGWHQYAFAGGLALGLLLAAAGALAVYGILRPAASAASPDDPDWPPGPVAGANPAWQAYTRTGATGSVAAERPLLRIVAGDEDRPAHPSKSGKLRRRGVALAIAASLLLVPACSWIAGSLARRNFVAVLSQLNGGQVSMGTFDLSLLTGEFTAGDLSAVDPERPDRSRLSIGVAKGILSPGLLLRGYLDVKNLTLTGVRADARSPADAVRARGVVAPNPSADEIDVTRSLACWNDICRGLGSFQRLVVALEELAEVEESTVPVDTSIFSMRSDLGTRRPLVHLKNIRVADLASCTSLGPRSLLELADVSSNPRLTGKATEIKIVAPKFGGQLRLALSHAGSDKKHHLQLSVYDLDVVPLLAARRVTVAGGQARLSGEGSVDRRSVDLRLTVEIDSLAAELAGGGPWAGIDPAVLNRGLRRLNGFRAELLLTGNFKAPTLRVDSQSLVSEFKQQLRSAGEFALADTLEQEVARRRSTDLGLAVVPASAVEVPGKPPRPGWAEFTEESSIQEHRDEAVEPEPVVAAQVGGPDGIPDAYPATETPDEDFQLAAPPPGPHASHTAANIARPLPGPMNLVVGHDPAAGLSSTFDRVGAVRRDESVTPSQGNAISRWAQGLRQRFGHVATQPGPPRSPEPAMDPEPPDAVIPAAASEAWYNRRWR